jgi:hypothetical protein
MDKMEKFVKGLIFSTCEIENAKLKENKHMGVTFFRYKIITDYVLILEYNKSIKQNLIKNTNNPKRNYTICINYIIKEVKNF